MRNRITLKKSIKIINDEYVIKKKKDNIINTYNYLKSRAFDYFPEVLKEEEDTIYTKYIPDIDEPKEQKIIDLINVITLLHSKTTMYKEIDIDNYKYIYEEVNKEIDDILNYYNIVMDNIELAVYPSPSNYLIERNISFIYSAIRYAKRSINYWYKLIENKRKVRLVTVHNNLSLDHYLKHDRPYLISWDKSKIDMPIYDLISLYNNHYLEFDFTELLDIYLNKYPLQKEELLLFLTIISIPKKITSSNSEYKNVLTIRRQLDYIYKTSEIVKKYNLKDNIELEE